MNTSLSPPARRSLLLGVLALLAASAQAQSIASESVGIVSVTTGWADDLFDIVVDRPVLNPSNCSARTSYVSYASTSGYKTHYAAVLVASNTACMHGRLVIIGLAMNQ
jgi:catabolite regulation protein CreA